MVTPVPSPLIVQPTVRLYLDESGDHTRSDFKSIGTRYLGLLGIVMRRAVHVEFERQLDQLKRENLLLVNGKLPVLHRDEIVGGKGPFSPLKDPAIRRRWDDGLCRLLTDARFRIVCIVIDKKTHFSKAESGGGVRPWKDPYHQSLELLLERYIFLLQNHDLAGDVVAESRGKKENNALGFAFRQMWLLGGSYIGNQSLQRRISSRELKFERKAPGVAGGIQLADLLAKACLWDTLITHGRIDRFKWPFDERLAELVQAKYHQSNNGQVNGYGRKLLG